MDVAGDPFRVIAQNLLEFSIAQRHGCHLGPRSCIGTSTLSECGGHIDQHVRRTQTTLKPCVRRLSADDSAEGSPEAVAALE